MTIVNGHYDGKRVVLDEPVPTDIPADTLVQIVFDGADAKGALEEIARLARPGGKPPDYSQQHEHYVKSTPRRT